MRTTNRKIAYRRPRRRAFEHLEARHLLAAQPIISEFMASNRGGLADEDGDESDWIEISNVGDAAVDLDGWHLTDDATSPQRWTLPSRTLDPGEHLVVFASNKNRNPDTGELHTNFRLSAGGEYLALVQPDGTTIASEFAPTFPLQLENVSYGTPSVHAIVAPADAGGPIVSDGLIAYYAMEETAGALTDQAGGQQASAVNAGHRYNLPGPTGFGKAVGLNANGSWQLSVADSAELRTLANNITVTSWVYVESTVVKTGTNSALHRIIGDDVAWDGDGWAFGVWNDGRLRFTKNGVVDQEVAANVPRDQWVHVAATVSSSTGTTFYLNGAVIGTHGNTANMNTGLGNNGLADAYAVGRSYGAGEGQWFGGRLDETRVYNRVLTPTEIGTLMNPVASGENTTKVFVPADGSLGNTWTAAAFNDGAWTDAPGAIGYETVAGGPFEDAILHAVPTGTTSFYTRTTFALDDAAQFDTLLLRTQYDDGFVAYLNGTKIAEANAPAAPQWNSIALADRNDASATNLTAFDVSAFASLLIDGDNVLAIHALNDSAASPRMLMVPDLIVVASQSPNYLLSATPNELNTLGRDFGQFISDVAHAPSVPTATDPVVVTASVSELSDPVDTVTLTYRVMYAAGVSISMVDDGTGNDAAAGDGIYTATIPAGAAGAGQMLRYFVTTQDTAGGTFRAPFLPDPANAAGYPEYFGTVIADPSVTTALPVFQWFVPNPTWHMNVPGNPGSGNNRNLSPASAFYDGEFYDNIGVHVRGSSTTQNWAKPKFKFQFNDSHEFRYADDRERVDEFNLQSHFIEVLFGVGPTSQMRETIAQQFLQEVGAPASTAFHMRVQQNGQFYSLASFIEEVDTRFLRRYGFDDTGAMYKASPTIGSTLAPNPTSSSYQKVNRENEPFTDLIALTNGISGLIPGVSRENYLFDNVNLPQIINDAAAQVVLLNHDRLTKNYYVYRDPTTGEWSRFPWDTEQAFSDPPWAHFISVLYGDSEHTQGTNNETQYRNYLYDAMFDTPRIREMYVQRVRSLMDQYMNVGYFQDLVNQTATLIGPEAALDNAKWGTGAFQTGLSVLLGNIERRRNQLEADPLIPDGTTSTTFTTLLSENASVSLRVPTSAADAAGWETGDANYNDTAAAGWRVGTSGIGYERGTGYAPFFGTLFSDDARTVPVSLLSDIDTNGDGTNEYNGVYARYKFDVADPSDIDILQLRARYDDGFVAFLNGVQVASGNFTAATRAWNSFADNAGHEASTSFDVFDITNWKSQLVAGTNVLAIHLMNADVASSDLLLQPTIVAGVTEDINPGEVVIAFGTPNGENGDSGLTEDPGEIVFNPLSGNQDEEYISIINSSAVAVDISLWRVSGGVEFTFQPGTVIPAGGTLYLSPDVTAFRARTTGPSGGQGIFVQGVYSGHLSNFGETLNLVSTDNTVVATVTTPTVPSDNQQFLRVTEIMYHPADPTAAELTAGHADADLFEFIELHNTSATLTLDLTNVRFTNGITFTFGNTLLAPGAYAVLVSNIDAFAARYGAVPVAGQYTGNLSNGGEGLKIEDADGGTIHEFAYDDVGIGWHSVTDGSGPSLVITSTALPLAAWGNGPSWRPSFATAGTPGADDPILADIDGNGRVDLSDLAIIQRYFGTIGGATPAMGDLNGDGNVNRADVARLAAYFGHQTPVAPAPSAAHSPAAALAFVRRAESDTARLVARRRMLASSAVDEALTVAVEFEIGARGSATRPERFAGQRIRSIGRPSS
ncbi:MAG: lamin tail domain-containing protein [Pirellulales bacterium]